MKLLVTPSKKFLAYDSMILEFLENDVRGWKFGNVTVILQRK